MCIHFSCHFDYRFGTVAPKRKLFFFRMGFWRIRTQVSYHFCSYFSFVSSFSLHKQFIVSFLMTKCLCVFVSLFYCLQQLWSYFSFFEKSLMENMEEKKEKHWPRLGRRLKEKYSSGNCNYPSLTFLVSFPRSELALRKEKLPLIE